MLHAASCGDSHTCASLMLVCRGKILAFDGVQRPDPSGNVNTDAYSIGEFFTEGICAPR